ncbi:MAG: DUF6526 family protein [Ferruginibacter sp.]
MKQQYSNHRKYYIPHHFILLPVLGILLGMGVWKSFCNDGNELAWRLFSISVFLILCVSVMMRQHYALGNQDRIILLEFKLRYFELTGKNAADIVKQLQFSQVAALRFASDQEFMILLTRALQEGLSGNEIKKLIKDWQPDENRV